FSHAFALYRRTPTLIFDAQQPDFAESLDYGAARSLGARRRVARGVSIQMPVGLRSCQLAYRLVSDDPAPHFARALANGEADAARHGLSERWRTYAEYRHPPFPPSRRRSASASA